ncbi:MAG: hypothetical protein MUF54_24225 [Polyangiaceae bacterium]|nr:hypothetical protein [Polyangiaceae bacterium]
MASVVLLAAFLATSAVGVVRGVLDAGAIDLGLTQGYFGTLNSVRLFKPYAWALLLCPLLIAAMRRSRTCFATALGWGLTAGLGIVALGSLWERAAFTDILNFSSDYRTTSLFWEMHVGGAALDGYLALAFPFALWLAWDARGRWAHGAAVAVVLLAAYAALTTFSRGVFAALPIGVVVWVVLRLRQNPGASVGISMRVALAATAFVVVSGVVAWAVFQHGGYRGLIAIVMAFGAIVLALPAMRLLPLSILTLALLSGLLVALLIWALDPLISKGPYVLHALLFGICVGTALAGKQVPERGRAFALAAMAFALVFSAINVSLHWGGATNSALVVVASCVVALAGLYASRSALCEPLAVRRNQLRLGAGVLVLGAVVSVFSGGAYMGERFSTSREDLDGRLQHWTASLGVMGGAADWLLGKGVGRYPASYFYHVPDTQLPGSYSWKEDGGNGYLSLSGPRYGATWGDLFRVAQRVDPVRGTYVLEFRARARSDVQMHAEVCEKHLLYNEDCAIVSFPIKATESEWRAVRIEMDGKTLSGGPWYAPQLAFFAIAVASSGQNAELDEIRLFDPTGRDVIANGGFAQGSERWFITSDRHHLPWHVKNLFLNVLFEQGVLGLAALICLLGAFLWRVAFGSVRSHPMAPALAASVTGFVVVGMFDSLLDVPRVAWQFYMLLCIGLLIVPAGLTASTARVRS